MSVFVVLRVPGDPNTLEQYAQANTEMMQRISAAGKAAGARRHAFAGGENEIVVIDEWASAEAFRQFFDGQPEIPRLMQEGGATGAPEISIYRKLDTTDDF
jgi:heme-degrading monooxygenase HmoA